MGSRLFAIVRDCSRCTYAPEGPRSLRELERRAAESGCARVRRARASAWLGKARERNAGVLIDLRLTLRLTPHRDYSTPSGYDGVRVLNANGHAGI